ncbi:hypothetical protein ONE63_011477 [Megalurothrips usitatus]|uniref:Uncharacterized protein n=1 Tax=Megalurothrips usitatus TaxID=439358 RepID=A0AAV7X2C3_9NEOP|nr:hypothetical protein ONE63_011477 [Megalurothrips usitatus]
MLRLIGLGIINVMVQDAERSASLSQGSVEFAGSPNEVMESCQSSGHFRRTCHGVSLTSLHHVPCAPHFMAETKMEKVQMPAKYVSIAPSAPTLPTLFLIVSQLPLSFHGGAGPLLDLGIWHKPHCKAHHYANPNISAVNIEQEANY